MRFGIMAAMLALVACSASTADPADGAYDLIIANGKVVDGSGNPWIRADVGIRGKHIAAVGDLSAASAKRRIDAKGRVVAPGFIDMHAHPSWTYLVDSRVVSKLTQGITLEIEGEGSSVAPMNEAEMKRQLPDFRRYGVKPTWRSLDDFFKRLEAAPATINFATHVGTSTVRRMAVGYDDRPATPAERQKMRDIVEQAMKDGALGVYSALMYSPDRYNSTDELIDIARVAARYGGVYQTHPRSESDAFMESMDEIVRIAREAKIPAHLTHMKLTYVQNWGKMPALIKRIEAARAAGLDITADLYPYERAGGAFTPLLPPWAQDGGRDAIVKRLRDPRTRERIKRELVTPTKEWENEYLGTSGGPEGITILSAPNPKFAAYAGRTVADIAKTERRDPRDVVLDIILGGDAIMTVLITGEQDMRLAMQQPWMAFGTDGDNVAPDGPLSKDATHPRAYGSYPRIFGRYVRELKLLRLEDAVRKATSLAAQRLNIRDRGLLREGYYADIVLFDPETIIDTATYEEPHQIAKGVHTVVVNGQVVLDKGVITAARPGMVVRGPGWKKNVPVAANGSGLRTVSSR